MCTNTTFRWPHRFLALPDGQRPEKLVGIAEADETLFLQSFKGRRGDKALCSVAKEMGIPRKAVNLAAGLRVLDGVHHVQSVNAHDSRLKEWMQRFHGVATRHLAHYLGWRRLIERHHNVPTPSDVLAAALTLTIT